jgi:hypothetical protein
MGLIVDLLLLLDRAFGDHDINHGAHLKIMEPRIKLTIET